MGYQLALEIDGSSNLAVYDWSGWTDGSLYDTDGNVKTSAFFEQTTMVKLEMTSSNGDVNSIELQLDTPQSLQELFLSSFTETDAAISDWHALIADAGYQPNCNYQGFNLACYGSTCQAWQGSDNGDRMRLGIYFNEQDDCTTSDTSLGIGNSNYAAGNYAASACSSGDCSNKYDVTARLFVFIDGAGGSPTPTPAPAPCDQDTTVTCTVFVGACGIRLLLQLLLDACALS